MYDYLDIIDILEVDISVLKDIEIPEPMDNWSVEDFRDFIPGER